MRARFSLLFLAAGLLALRGAGAEWRLDLLQESLDRPPKGFRSALTGQGAPGDWRVKLDEIPSLLPALNPKAPRPRQPVIAQLSQDPTDERFPLLIYEKMRFRDFALHVKFKLMGGRREQMAGVAFRLQDTNNYYVVRASRLGKTFRFYSVRQGRRSPPVGPSNVSFETNRWYDLDVECEGNLIRIRLDRKPLIPELTDYTFREGHIALWTKSDSVSYFTDLRVRYTPRIPFGQQLVKETLKRYPKLLGLKVFAVPPGGSRPQIIGSDDPKEVGKPGGKVETAVIQRDIPYAGKVKGRMWVTLPLHDRNGEPIAAARIVMRSFLGQTAKNAVIRATPIIRSMEKRVLSLEDLFR